MSAEQAPFDAVAANFREYEQTVRGHVRYESVHRNLREFLPPPPATMLDAQGGSGPDAAWLAGIGYHVTLLEESKKQRGYAAERRAELPAKARERMVIEPGTLADIGDRAGTFDIVLNHCVAQYQANPSEYLRQVVRFARAGGLISILEKGYFGALPPDPIPIKDKSALEALDRLQRTQRVKQNGLGLEVYAFKTRELREIVETEAKILHWSGVRFASETDYREITSVDPAELSDILDQEHETGKDPEWRATGKLLHFIAEKT